MKQALAARRGPPPLRWVVRLAVTAALLALALPAAAEDAAPSSSPVPPVTPSPQPSPDPTPSPAPRLQVHGFVDTYYAHNANRPFDGASFVPGTGTNAKRHNEFSLNLANLDLSLDPAPVGLRLVLAAGTASDVVHGGEPAGVAIGPDVWRHVQYASVSYKARLGRGLLLEGGIYPCHVGFESLPSKDNWNYTRSWLGEFSPYYVSGVKAAYNWTDRWTTQVHLLNGWQSIGETNGGKTLGTHVAWNAPRASVAFNTLIGQELAQGDEWRVLGEVVATFRPTAAFSMGASIDLVREGRPQRDEVTWNGVAGYLRYAFDRRWAAALRVERFEDDEGAISGTGQTLSEGTATLDFRPAEALILRLEGRYDRSTAPVFGGKSSDPGARKWHQLLIVLGAVAVF